MSATEQAIPSTALAYLNPEFREIFAKPTATITQAGRVLGRGRNTAYKLARSGAIETIPETDQVSTVWLARKIGLLPPLAA